MYKKTTKLLVFLLAFLLLLSACDNGGDDNTTADNGGTSAEETTAEEESAETVPSNEYGDTAVKTNSGDYVFVPTLWLRYMLNGGYVSTNTPFYECDWTDDDANTASYIGNPLSSYQVGAQLTKTDELTNIEVVFTQSASSISVRRWSAEYADDLEKLEDYETVTHSNGVFSVDAGYIYEVAGTWSSGTASYVFQVN